MAHLLETYHRKRDFGITAEPKGKLGKSCGKKLNFVIQLHQATRTHYDFRLEWNGVMKSWAVTKGPSYDPTDKRLAVRTEDHPMDYNHFEGVIPSKQYGAGPVMIWDEGLWFPEDDPEKMEKKGRINFRIEGSRMHGDWHLVRMHTKEKRENWLLIKATDDHVMTGSKNENFLKSQMTSAVTQRTMDEIIKAGLGNTSKKAKSKAKKVETPEKSKKSGVSLTKLQKQYVTPELATLVENPPTDNNWVHEIKYDGYRLMAFVADQKCMLITRGGKDWTHKFQPLADAFSKLAIDNGVFDLEAGVLDATGRTSFSDLQQALTDQTPERIEGWVFDLLHLNGEDYTDNTLLERKDTLQKVLKKAKAPLHYSDHFESSPDLLGKACKIGAEGLVSKRKDSTYIARRTQDWVKSKCGHEQEFVIGGFMPAKDNSKAVGALLLGYYENKKLRYAGKVGTGFTRKTSMDIYKKLIGLKADASPFVEKLERGLRSYVYLKPDAVCEISFLEWTADEHIRHGVFKGLREDKKASLVKREIPKTTSKIVKEDARPARKKRVSKKKTEECILDGVTITHPEREVFPGTGITKGDVARYYDMMAEDMLPYIKDRLISLLRCTDGINGQCFFQRNPMKGMGQHIKPKPVTHKDTEHEYLYIQTKAGVIELAQMGVVEFHAWQSKLKPEGKPDQIIFDLDPAEDVPFEAVKLAAEDIRRRLSKLGLISFARLSGGKGVHVVVPIKPQHSWDIIKELARKFSETMARDVPAAYIANMSKDKRKGKIFIDFFRNDFSSTAIVPFSLRARENAPLAWPVSWADLKKAKSANEMRLKSISPAAIKRARKQTDEFLALSQSLKLR